MAGERDVVGSASQNINVVGMLVQYGPNPTRSCARDKRNTCAVLREISQGCLFVAYYSLGQLLGPFRSGHNTLDSLNPIHRRLRSGQRELDFVRLRSNMLLALLLARLWHPARRMRNAKSKEGSTQ